MSPLDPAQDPDRFDPDREPEPLSLDPALDPDRYRDPTLPELMGREAGEDRDVWESVIGLLAVLLFLGLVTAALYLL